MADISIELLREVLRYEPETGKLYWRERTADMVGGNERVAKMNLNRHNKRLAGKECFRCVNKDGYLHGTLFNQKLAAHQVIWALTHGVWSTKDMHVDHINGIKSDNRIANLRLIPAADNIRARIRRSYKNGGERGICKNLANGKWQVSVRLDNARRKYLGCFDKITEARSVRDAAEWATNAVQEIA